MEHTVYLAPSMVAYKEIIIAVIVGIFVGAPLWIFLAIKFVEKRFPLKLRKVNNLKAKYNRSLKRIERREDLVYFVYNLLSETFDSIGHEIAEVAKEEEKETQKALSK